MNVTQCPDWEVRSVRPIQPPRPPNESRISGRLEPDYSERSRLASLRVWAMLVVTTALAIPVWPISSFASGQEMQRLELADEPVFISADHPNPRIAQIGRLDGALLVGSSQVAFVDGVSQTLEFVDVATGATWTAQADGTDVEIRPSLRILDRFDGLVVTDRSGSVTVFARNGQAVDQVAYDPFAMSFTSPARAVGMFPDRRLIFRRSENARPGFSLAALAGPGGIQRDTVRYETPTIGGSATVLAKGFLDDEEIFLTTRADGVTSSGTERIIFGQRLFEARVGEQLVIVQTDRAQAAVYDWAGMRIAEFPIPGVRPQVTAESVEAQRTLRIRAKERDNEVKRRAKELSYAENFGAVYSTSRDSVRIAQLPANDTAPSVDHLFGDLDGRVWLRLFAMPSDTVVYWRVWSVGRTNPEFELKLPRAKRLLDASGDLLLLRTTNDFGADEFVIQRMITITDGHDQLPARSSRSPQSYTTQPVHDPNRSRHKRRQP